MLAGIARSFPCTAFLPAVHHSTSQHCAMLSPRLLQKDDALRVALQENAALQQDLRCMLAAREPLAALRTSLQRVVGSGPFLFA
jgi:hypothetical protein